MSRHVRPDQLFQICAYQSIPVKHCQVRERTFQSVHLFLRTKSWTGKSYLLSHTYAQKLLFFMLSYFVVLPICDLLCFLFWGLFFVLFLTLSLPLGCHEFSGKVHSVQFVCCYRMNANFLHKCQLWIHSKATLSSKDEHF